MKKSKLQLGDYLIVSRLSSRPALVKLTEERDKKLVGYLDVPSTKDDQKTVSFSRSDILATLGKFPKPGTIYGVKVEPLLRVIKSSAYGEIRIYQKADQDRIDQVVSLLKETRKIIKEHKHTVPYNVEIRNPTGKMAGYYKYMPKEEFDIMCIKPDTVFSDFQYIVLHEHGHAVWNRRMNELLKSKWIKLYHYYVSLLNADDAVLRQILEDIHQTGNIAAYMKEAEDDVKATVKAVLRHINQVHSLGKHHLDLQLRLSQPLDEYWPTAVDFSFKTVAVTDYGRKSPEELFAESYAFNMLGRTLPKKVANLMDSTLSKLHL